MPAVREPDRHRSLTHRAADALDRAVADVAGLEQPGTLVSSASGSRARGQSAGRCPPSSRSGPVRMKSERPSRTPPCAAHEHRDARTGVREVHHRLTCRIARSHDDHLAAAALRGLAAARPVVDTAAEQLLDTRDVKPPPHHPGSDQHDSRAHHVTSAQLERELPVGSARAAARHATQHHELGAEALRLAACKPAQLGAPDPVWEAEEFSISDVCDACPPGICSSITTVERPSDAA